MSASGKFCPTCKNKNSLEAVICRHCGAPLNTDSHLNATTKNTEIKINYSEKPKELTIDESIVPNDGIAIYFAETTKPVEILTDDEFVIGRKVITTNETFLDLSDFDGFKMGLSRRHAMIKRTDSGYEIIDLSSTNGTWLNDERLVPYTAYPLASGARLRLSRIRLVAYYRMSEEKES